MEKRFLILELEVLTDVESKQKHIEAHRDLLYKLVRVPYERKTIMEPSPTNSS